MEHSSEERLLSVDPSDGINSSMIYRSKGDKFQAGCNIIYFSVMLILSLIVMVLSSMWNHMFGIICAVAGFIFAIVGIIGACESAFRKRKWLWRIYVISISLLITWLTLLLLVQVIGWDPVVRTFPQGCNKITNCARVTTDNATNVRADGLTAPRINSTIQSVEETVSEWIKSKHGKVLYSDGKFIHARFVSFLFGFADDFYTQIVCNEIVRVNVQAEARLGTSDLGVNVKRVKEYIEYLNAQTFNPGPC